jgi:hypothetical protein
MRQICTRPSGDPVGCRHCGAIAVVITIQGSRPLEMLHCSVCDWHSWEIDGRPTSLATVVGNLADWIEPGDDPCDLAPAGARADVATSLADLTRLVGMTRYLSSVLGDRHGVSRPW